MTALRQVLAAITIAAVLLGIAFALYALARNRPQDLPWTPLDLGERPGAFTGSKLAALTNDRQQCVALLRRAGVRFTALKPVRAGPRCGYADGVRLDAGGARRIGFSPPGVGMACPVAAGLAMLEWHVIQPAAARYFGQRVRTIEHFGSYNCRRIAGRDTRSWSEHATADAFDLAGVVLADGRRITVARDWEGKGADAAFLHAVRDGACGVFATVLSPEYNAAHRDHLHLDQADRGRWGWRGCR